MNLGELRQRVVLQLPQATGETLNPATINLVINQSCDRINLIAQAYKTFASVANVPSQQIFSLSTICPGYLTMSKSGVWWFTTAGTSMRMWPKTRRWLDNFIINWRDQAPVVANPTWYWHDGDELGFQPASTQLSTNANKDFRVHYLLASTPMGGDNYYPWWNKITEMTALKAFDDAIIAYAVWKLSPALMDKEGRNYYEVQFKNEVKLASTQVKRQWDLTSDYDYYIRPDVASGFLPR